MPSQPDDIFTQRTRDLKRWWFGADQEERDSMLDSKNQLPKPKLPTLAEASAWRDKVIASIEARSIRQNDASKKPQIPTGPEAQGGTLDRDRIIHPSACKVHSKTSKVYSQLNGNGR